MKIIDGANRNRPGVYIVDYRDANGVRHSPSFPSLAEAEKFAEDELAYRETGGVNPNCTFAEFLPCCVLLWREAQELEEATIEGHLQVCEDHILPYFTTTRVRVITHDDVLKFKAHLKTQLTRGGKKKSILKKRTPLVRGTITRILSTLSSLFRLAIHKKIRVDNPAARNGRLDNTKVPEEDKVQPIAFGKALSKPERDRLLLAARVVVNQLYYVFLCLLAGTGLRPGEARALLWRHIDLDGSREQHNGIPMLTIQQTFKKKGRLGKTKNGKVRWVETPTALVPLLQALFDLRQPRPTDYVFSEATTPHTALSECQLRKPWPTLLALAGITRWIPLYGLRHTYASILIWEGVSVSFVCAQLGHANTAVTETYYLHWIKRTSTGVLAKLGLGRTMVASLVVRPRTGGSGAETTH